MDQIGPTSCIACGCQRFGMISIHNHPNELDKMFQFATGIKVKDGDYLCVTCYDELKIAYNFKQKSIRNNTNTVTCVDEKYPVGESQPDTSKSSQMADTVIDALGGNLQQDGNSKIPKDSPVEAEARCEVCNKTFRKARLLRGHMMAHHQTEESLNLSKFYSIIM